MTKRWSHRAFPGGRPGRRDCADRLVAWWVVSGVAEYSGLVGVILRCSRWYLANSVIENFSMTESVLGHRSQDDGW